MIIFTKHALERLQQRNISKASLDKISAKEFLSNQDQDNFGNYVLQIQRKQVILRVFYRIEGEDIVIITVYETSKVNKYRN